MHVTDPYNNNNTRPGVGFRQLAHIGKSRVAGKTYNDKILSQ